MQAKAWANRLSIWVWACSSWVLRRSPNGYHWVLSIIWFSLALTRGRRLGDNAVRCVQRVHLPSTPTLQ